MSDSPDVKTDPQPNWRLKSWFPDLDEGVHLKMRQYFLELQKFNKVINLVSSKSLLHGDAIHFADSIRASVLIRQKVNKNNYLYDIGSGNGFPGMIYAILYPDQRVILLDSDQRKCEFLKHVVEALGLMNVVVQNKKIEQCPEESIEQGICRGYSPLPRALLALRKVVKRGGSIYHLKSSEWADEISQIPIQLCSTWQPALEAEYALPIGAVTMYVVRTTKFL